MGIQSFDDFWPYYVRAHSRARTRVLHAIGSVAAVVLLGISFAVSLWFLIAVPLVGYAFAWYAHFFVEKNRPATFGHPFYSLAADYRMTFLMMAGRMNEEVAKYVTAAASRPVSPEDSQAASSGSAASPAPPA
jgi:hypothetical protein